MAGNSNLHDSSRNKQDEFYTNLQLIEDELKHYRAHFKGKRVLCNCDDPYESNFFKYVAMNFNALGLKSLIATCYAASPFAQMELDLFGNGECVGRKERKGTQRRKSAYKIVDNRSEGREWRRTCRSRGCGVAHQEQEECADEDGDERHLSIRKFSDKMARTAYERQKGVCPKCGRKFAIEEMEADHIKPWSKGGRTVAENCQMLCADCNRRKGGK